ncbi:RNA polymerase sigma-70 factor [Sphingobacterium sp. SGG-5]|uniref:RNA polymerase sigma factor n=1 Tax=Sphingobacterium sp. SGG-5 TaxID=2710881 RepID=UPI0013E9B2EC|nr:RNA polymerase sigma-70 factor [Sphingobacterium sp. SGG-5]NGM61111.1 RNA polymerase sigma-70 factor [Sphingobacterium sp. SGG-5]
MALAPLSDEHNLLEHLREGDRVAFTTLYNRYWRKLFVVATNKLKDPAIAEEITQDIFADLWVRRESLAIRGSLESYLAVALKYKVIDIMAHEQHRRRYVNTLTGNAHVDDSTRQWLDYEELRHRLETLVNKLPEKCRIVYALRQGGNSQKEIAQQLGISTNTVENHLAKAYKLIRQRLHYTKQIIYFQVFKIFSLDT